MSTADAWIAALSGLVGAIIGALASVGAVVWLDNSKEKRAAARAKRLIAGELLQAHYALAGFTKTGKLSASVDMATMFPVTAWQEYGAQLEGITDEVGDFVVRVYTEILQMRGSLAFLTVQIPGGTIGDELSTTLRNVDADITKLRTALGGRDVSN
jgi:hypothetical protein